MSFPSQSSRTLASRDIQKAVAASLATASREASTLCLQAWLTLAQSRWSLAPPLAHFTAPAEARTGSALDQKEQSRGRLTGSRGNASRAMMLMRPRFLSVCSETAEIMRYVPHPLKYSQGCNVADNSTADRDCLEIRCARPETLANLSGDR